MAVHRYWKVEVHGSSFRQNLDIKEIELRESTGGADATTPSTTIDFSTEITSVANLIDNDTGTTADAYNFTSFPYVVFDFGSGTEVGIVEFYLDSASTLDIDIVISYSDDNNNFYEAYSTYNYPVSSGSNYTFNWDPNYVVLSNDTLTISNNYLPIYPAIIVPSLDTLSITNDNLTVLINQEVNIPLSSDSLTITDGTLSVLTVQTIALSTDALSILDNTLTVSSIYTDAITDILNVLDINELELNVFKSVAENIDAIVTALDEYIAYLADDISYSDTLVSSYTGSIEVEDLININDLIRISFLIAALDNIDVLDTTTFLKESYSTIDEEILANLELLTNLAGTNIVTDYIDVQDFIEKPFVELLTEAIDATSSFLPSLIVASLASDDIHVDEVLVNLKLLNMSNSDAVEVLSTLNSNAILHNILSDYVTFTLLDEDGREHTYYGWAYNPDNHAVTNYDFNFSEVTNYKNSTYLANSSGLYLLDGNQDEGEYIQSQITTAGLNFGKRTEKQIPQVFIGIGGTNHIVTVSVDEQTTAYYELVGNQDDGLITKTLKPGKGLVGNTWQFSIIDVDQLGFDLTSLEFFPIFFGRKHRK